MEQFLEKFPSTEKLIRFFAPSMWGYCLQHIDDCVNQPCITLSQVDAVYNQFGVAQNIVKSQFVGIYSLSTAREELNQQAANLATDIFISKYGNECTLYGLMLYFSGYLTEYKASFSQYDVQDILQQFSKKFLPWWRNKVGIAKTEDQEPVKERGISIQQMLRIWVQEGRTDEDFRNGGLYRTGQITDAMIRKARKEVADGIF